MGLRGDLGVDLATSEFARVSSAFCSCSKPVSFPSIFSS